MTKYIDANSFLEYEENRCKNSPCVVYVGKADCRYIIFALTAEQRWTEVTRMTDKELIRALRGTQSRSKRALLDEAAERILDYAVDFACPKPDKYQAKCGSVLHSIGECRTCWERYLAEEAGDE